MLDGGIRDFLQDMKNENGLSQAEGKLPHAAATMADAGYKEGEVTMEGTRKGKREKVVTGQSAARVSIELEGLRQYVKGQESLARSKDAKIIVTGVLTEIGRILPKPEEVPALGHAEGESEGPQVKT
jgi:hypothetical protein